VGGILQLLICCWRFLPHSQEPSQLKLSQDQFERLMNGNVIGNIRLGLCPQPLSFTSPASCVSCATEATEGLTSIRHLKELAERMRRLDNKHKVPHRRLLMLRQPFPKVSGFRRCCKRKWACSWKR
jgi:hypothetical protein